jgi:hypothetical protein
MVPRITAVLMPLKTDWVARLQSDAITAACEQVGYTAWRNRLLAPVIIVQWFLLQMLHGITAYRHLPHVSGIRSASWPTVRLVSHGPCGFSTTSWHAWDTRLAPHAPRKPAGMVIARSSSN